MGKEKVDRDNVGTDGWLGRGIDQVRLPHFRQRETRWQVHQSDSLVAFEVRRNAIILAPAANKGHARVRWQ